MYLIIFITSLFFLPKTDRKNTQQHYSRTLNNTGTLDNWNTGQHWKYWIILDNTRNTGLYIQYWNTKARILDKTGNTGNARKHWIYTGQHWYTRQYWNTKARILDKTGNTGNARKHWNDVGTMENTGKLRYMDNIEKYWNTENTRQSGTMDNKRKLEYVDNTGKPDDTRNTGQQ
ncbi:hypothetical protein Glove_59g68 [Diversispora epigaea]|uniref:Uncharacterized protein n=1 Tax=Diversispora epigaea TaxID=1348612 RepID=A0A397JMZ9_9GLOM|nr:hypothetical protein Glove_59g68 [Diversispora epigaea]